MRKWVPALPYLSGVGEGAGTGCEQMGPCLYGNGDRSRPCVQLRILLNPGVGLGVFQSESPKSEQCWYSPEAASKSWATVGLEF